MPIKFNTDLTAEQLREVLDYNPVTGIFTWKVCRGCGCPRVGEVAGTPSSKGYIVISLRYKRYKAHRLAWLHFYGKWPEDQIDHKDTIKTNNSIDNLRPATNSQNMANALRHNGLKGVTYDRGRWIAQITKNRRKTYLGSFSTKEEAHAAYALKAKELHGEFSRLA